VSPAASSRGIFPAALLAACALSGCQQASQGNQTVTTATEPAHAAKATNGFVDVAGVKIAYAIHGDLTGKTPLVVLHGSLMSGEAMAPIVDQFTATRPVITIDARGHGRTGVVPGTLTYPQLADDTAAVLKALKVTKADVLGYSMGGTTAIQLGARHPELIDKLVILSGAFDRSGYPPEVLKGFAQWKPDMFKGTPIERSYRQQSATPYALPALVDQLRGLESSTYDVPPAALRAIPGKTMIVIGDADGITLAHALKLFAARGGDNLEAAKTGMMAAAPRARLAVLPATTHVAILTEAPLIGELVRPFLEDRAPPPPAEFFTGNDKPQAGKGEKK
jgi:pimeloyl-ACP methyl ester carboxylesterase